MDISGKKLEIFVKTIEEIFLPKGFIVDIRRKKFNDDGIQIAEFDVIIEGKLGTTQISWLIECRDRPSEGSAPGDWIEQLVGRRDRFKYNKVTAVSTTGFSPGAVEYAKEVGIEIRNLSEVSEDRIHEWFRVTELKFHNLRGELLGVVVYTEPKLEGDLLQKFEEKLNSLQYIDPVLIIPSTGQIVSFLNAWQHILNTRQEMFEGITPNQDHRKVMVVIDYIPGSQYLMLLDGIELKIPQLIFTSDLSINAKIIPISRITDYSKVLEEKSIAQSVHFQINTENMNSDVSIHILPGISKIAITVNNLNPK